MENITWYEAVAYANFVSELDGLGPCYTTCTTRQAYGIQAANDRVRVCWPDRECAGFRLPTGIEWEHAARAGDEGKTYGDPTKIAWTAADYRHLLLDDVSGYHPMPGGLRPPNAWGLHDMLGNVDEWVWESADSPAALMCEERTAEFLNLTEPGHRPFRYSRGGSYLDEPEAIAVWRRVLRPPSSRGVATGVRLVRRAD